MNNNDSEFEDYGLNSEDELCPSVGMFVSLLTMDKPFGILWSRDNQITFLKKLGYKIIESKEDFTGYNIMVAVKPESEIIPDMDRDNIEETFSKEIQGILLDWLLKIKQS